jgi:DNA phosphorothioation-dependent restriction protein DptH
MTGKGNEGLDKAILDAARLMRHDGLRLVISTQSPKALNPEILELVSVAILHRFQSRDWFNYLHSKIELSEGDFDRIQELAPGSAIVYAGRRLFENEDVTKEKNFLMRVRPRITQDRGSSLVNKGL